MTVTRTDLLPGEWPPDWAEEFAAICDSHRGRLVRWLTSIFGPRDAEDIAQEALARLYARPGLLDDDADAWPWLSVVARNVGRDMARHNAFSLAVGHETLEQVAGQAYVPEQVLARDDARRLTKALRTISPRDRALLHLRDVQGVSVGDIAEALGMNDNAVRQQLFRARKRLASSYVALGGDRSAGIFGLCGLRVREFVRRHGHAFHAFGPTASGVFSHLAPAIAAVLGGALFLSTAPAAAVAATAVEQPSAATDPPAEVPHGVARVRPARLLAAAPATGRPPARPHDPPPWEYEHEVGPVKARGAVYRDPLDPSPGTTVFFQVHVDDVPVLGYVDVTVYDHQTGGHGPVCTALSCPTAVPTPPARR